MKDFDFKKIVYFQPFISRVTRQMTKIAGIDSEALKTGKPFLFCTSTGDSFNLNDIPGKLITAKYRGTNFIVYNLKYESGALTYNIPPDKKRELWNKQQTEYNGFRYRYLQHKLLRISRGKNSVSFWDIQPFYETSLDQAARNYLNKHKTHLKTKSFTENYVKAHGKNIKRYCIRDATLTKELADYLIKRLNKYGLKVNALYSPAAISFAYFKEHSKIITAWRFWQYYPGLLNAACEAFGGGKFEVTARGKFTGYEYDINSAYASEIRNLIDISEAEVLYSKDEQPGAIYAFLRCEIKNYKGLPSPVIYPLPNLRIYPAGHYYLTITLAEYKYLQSQNIEVNIISGYWLKVRSHKYPYRAAIDKIYNIKDSYKNKDAMMYNLAKRILNSFYGKMIQMIKQSDGKLKAGPGWNPIYAAIITANLRIRMTAYQATLKNTCLAVHTDSIITTVPLPSNLLSHNIGGLELKQTGKGLLIMTGIYDIGKKTANRGYNAPKGFNWTTYLMRNPNIKVLQFTHQVVKSWTKVISEGKKDGINLFTDETQEIKLNADCKRIWQRKITGRDLLAGLEYSLPRVIVEPYPNKKRWRYEYN